MQPCIDEILSKDELLSKKRPKPPCGGSGVINAPIKIDFGDEFNAIIGNLTYIDVITNRILDNVKNVQKQLGTSNIEFRLNVDDKYLDNEAIKKLIFDAVKNGDIQFYFKPNQQP